MSAKEVQHTSPQFQEARNPILTFDDALKLATARRTEHKEHRFYQERATVSLDTEWPITLFTIGDVHFGSIYCDTDRFIRDIKAIRETPNAYIVLMSNLIDNGNPSQFPDSMLANAMTPHDQVKGMNDLLKQLDRENKILAAVKSPCHEGWLWKKSGIDINELLFADTKFPTLENGGILTVKMQGADYKVGLFHQFGKFGSQFNKNHPSQQMNRMVLGGQADIVVLAHSHYGEALQTYYGYGANRRDVVYIRSGSYKGNVAGVLNDPPDNFIRDQSGMDGEPSGQSIMLRADRREMQAFLKPETALDFHNAIYTMRRITTAGIMGQVDQLLSVGCH